MLLPDIHYVVIVYRCLKILTSIECLACVLSHHHTLSEGSHLVPPYQMPYGDVVSVDGGCGPLYVNGPEVDCLLCQWGGCAPYWGPRGVLIQYINMLKK
jgi:hypothetical protein